MSDLWPLSNIKTNSILSFHRNCLSAILATKKQTQLIWNLVRNTGISYEFDKHRAEKMNKLLHTSVHSGKPLRPKNGLRPRAIPGILKKYFSERFPLNHMYIFCPFFKRCQLFFLNDFRTQWILVNSTYALTRHYGQLPPLTIVHKNKTAYYSRNTSVTCVHSFSLEIYIENL